MRSVNSEIVEKGTQLMSRRSFLTCLAAGSFVVLSPASAFALGTEGDLSEEDKQGVGGDESKDSDVESFVVSDGDATSVISIIEGENLRTVTVVNTQTGESNRIIYDMSAGTVFSTYTGQTASVGEAMLELGPISPQSSKTSYSYKRISYAQIKNVTGNVLNAASLAAAIVSLGGASLAVGIGSIVVSVASCIVGVTNPSSDHGLRLKIKTVKYYRNGSHIAYRTTKSIVEVTQY